MILSVKHYLSKYVIVRADSNYRSLSILGGADYFRTAHGLA